MSLTPLTVSEARAILRADEALETTFSAREASGQTLGADETDAWIHLVKSANDRIAGYEGRRSAPPKEFEVVSYPDGNEPDFQSPFCEATSPVASRQGYTFKRLTTDDAAELVELLRVSIDDKHWQAWHPRLRAIREKMIERLGDVPA